MTVTSKYEIAWRNVKIGDHAFITFNYSGNTDERIIPRAKGIKIWSTYELGGGKTNITVTGFVARNSRIALEEYFNNFDSLFSLNEVGDIIITDTSTSNTYTLPDCYLKSYSQESSDLKSNTFIMEFVKSL
ncbi:hypothetical protein LCGC14_0306040 [marine sediment metagenome]|uniref:Uncharacterized protein n=1 Tax=marine sediment metagenome TaxID=412755 RepID=A0A0F9TP00_9ZZZZ